MLRSPGFASLLATLLLLTAGSTSAPAARSPRFGEIPLSFEQNLGQVDRAVQFLGRGQGYTAFLTASEAVVSLRDARGKEAVVRLGLAGRRETSQLVGLDPRVTRSHYLRGNDPRHWQTGVPHFGRVLAEQVYPDVDLVFHGLQRQLEYDFVVAPGADPAQIRMVFEGADAIELDRQGRLILHTAAGDLVQPPPVVYQEGKGRRQRVAGRYVLNASREVGFQLGRYDRGRPLVIDPVLVYSTFLGGSGQENGNGIAVDAAGQVVVAGSTTSLTFPGVGAGSIQPANAGGFEDAFVTKLDADGTSILFSTFLGGDRSDIAYDVGLDAAGNIYVVGTTQSTAFPGVGPGSLQPALGSITSDAFVVKLDPTGSAFLYATYLGGSGSEDAIRMAVDGPGNAYVTGSTSSASFPGVGPGSLQPVNAGGTDGFVTQIDPSGTAILYSTFLGGSGGEFPSGIAIDGAGHAYVQGSTSSVTFPGVGPGSLQPVPGGGGIDSFVAKLAPGGTAIVFATFLGGSGFEGNGGIGVDAAGAVYVTGFTTSAVFPGIGPGSILSTHSGGADVFVTKLQPAGNAIAYSTFLGGSAEEDNPFALAVDATGRATVGGLTGSTNFPGVPGIPILGSSGDGFVTQLDPAGTRILFSAFLGGLGEGAVTGLATDGAGNVYATGGTSAPDFTGVGPGSLQPANAGGFDAFVTKIDAGLAITTVPTLSQWGLIALAFGLAVLGIRTLQRPA